MRIGERRTRHISASIRVIAASVRARLERCYCTAGLGTSVGRIRAQDAASAHARSAKACAANMRHEKTRGQKPGGPDDKSG